MQQGLSQSIIDQCVFYSKLGNKIIIVIIFVNDMFIFTDSMKFLQHFRLALKNAFLVKYLGMAKLILGINVTRDNKGNIYLDQSHYIDILLKKIRMQDCNLSAVLIKKNAFYSSGVFISSQQT